MKNETYKDRDGPESVSAHGDNLEIYPTVGGQVCIRQTKSKVSDEYPCVYIHPNNILALIEALQLVKPEAEAWATDHAATSNI
jgi:hypothetical protein